ncbi:uncharacterized protein LOC111072261 [Drosophila obscura]|uniref:uncharacterized protein LOC111072261 n=1 Tax=Drosophila obscura TaxID=7282 RepID=UPI000BA0D778|nr:uncharacterized protein LOC111072261 [Drosophila obscura]
MISISAIALVVYNIFLYSVAWDIKRIEEDPPNTQRSLLHVIPVVGKWIAPEQPLLKWLMDVPFSEFGDRFWSINVGLNTLLLLPAVLQQRVFRHITMIVAGIITWNLFVFQRVLVYYLIVAWALWQGQVDHNVLKFIFGGLCMSALHLALICMSIRFFVEEEICSKSPACPVITRSSWRL